jgi:hypothetical protein
MLARVCFAVLALATVSSPAFAAGQCASTAPMAPVVPSATEITAGTVEQGQAKLNNVFSDLHIYQSQLKGYRECLKSAETADKADGTKAMGRKDADGVTKANAAASRDIADYNATVDAEQKIADAINSAVKAHCARDHSDFCKPKS